MSLFQIVIVGIIVSIGRTAIGIIGSNILFDWLKGSRHNQQQKYG